MTLRFLRMWRLRRAFERDGIDAVAMALCTARDGHAAILRAFGAKVAADVRIAGPLSVVNASGGFANLTIEPGAILGAETHLDLAAPVSIGAGAVVEARAAILTSARAAGLRPGAVSERAASLGAGARLGTGATIMPGVTVGEGASIDPHALVAADIPARARFAWPDAADLELVRRR